MEGNNTGMNFWGGFLCVCFLEWSRMENSLSFMCMCVSVYIYTHQCARTHTWETPFLCIGSFLRRSRWAAVIKLPPSFDTVSEQRGKFNLHPCPSLQPRTILSYLLLIYFCASAHRDKLLPGHFRFKFDRTSLLTHVQLRHVFFLIPTLWNGFCFQGQQPLIKAQAASGFFQSY